MSEGNHVKMLTASEVVLLTINSNLSRFAATTSLEEVIPGFRTEEGAWALLHDYAVDLCAEAKIDWRLVDFECSFEHRGAPVARIKLRDAVTALGNLAT